MRSKLDEDGPDHAAGPGRPLAPGVTVIVPAYNEAMSIADTIVSLKRQTHRLAEILVVDDASTDGTGDIARALGATVLRPPSNTGSKAAAQSYALGFVATAYCVAIDADTVLEPDAIGRLVEALDGGADAACGFVVPRHVGSVWERGRYIEYLFAFAFYKRVQECSGKPLISSGCFSAYRTDTLRAVGGWSNRTMAEDMDLTWTLYRLGRQVRFVPEAVCSPIEPHNFLFLSRQLRRWSHGFVQNVARHWRHVIHIPYLRSILAVGFFDATVASHMYLLVLPALAIFIHPLFLLGYVIDLPAVAVPAIAKGIERKETGRVLASLPCFLVLRLVNAAFMLAALWSEFVFNRSLHVYEKGH